MSTLKPSGFLGSSTVRDFITSVRKLSPPERGYASADEFEHRRRTGSRDTAGRGRVERPAGGAAGPKPIPPHRRGIRSGRRAGQGARLEEPCRAKRLNRASG